MDDLALVQVLANEAKSHGALIKEYSPVTSLIYQNHMISGVEVMLNGQLQQFEASHIINVSGAWSNTILHMDSPSPAISVSPTKGVHLIVPRITGDHALILSAPQDQRVFFITPFKGNTLIGTTDTLYHGDADQVSVLEDDIRYLLDAAHYYFPEFSPDPSCVLSTYCGLRPLVGSTKTVASSISRDFVISKSNSGLWTMLGGKYTTHRHMAEQLLKQLF
jgi:glycerol-3-phosphate dehydrogenase